MTGAQTEATFDVDLIIAVHTPERDLVRAVRSVFAGNDAAIRVTIVCHNTPIEPITKLLGDLAQHAHLRLLELRDGIRSPAGPFNTGLDAATAPYTSVMGSDDELEPGAIDSWLRLAQKTGAEAVIARVRHASGAALPSPPTRPFRSRGLDAVKDRLSYRSAPLGLVSRKAYSDLRFTTGVRTGEDIGYVTQLWFTASQIAYDRRGPAYLIHADVAERVTTLAPPIADDLEFLEPLLASDVYASLSDAGRASLLTKTVRGTLFGLVQNRPTADSWPLPERVALAAVTTRLRDELRQTGLGERALSRADIALLETMQQPTVPVAQLLERSKQRRAFLTPAAMCSRRLRDVLRRDAPIRFAAATLLSRW